MGARRNNLEQTNAGWLYADVLLGLLIVFLAASAINKSSSDPDEPPSTTITTSTTTPGECSNISRDPLEFNIQWSPADGEDVLLNAIKTGLGERDNDNVGVLLVFGGSSGTSSAQAKFDAEEIWNVVKTGEKYQKAYKKFLFMESLPQGSAKLSFFMERLCG